MKHTISSGRMMEIDFLKGFAVLAVVIGHLVNFDSLPFRWIFGFHMPIFFLLYGFMVKDVLLPFPEFVLKQTKRLLIPSWLYRLFCTVVIVIGLEKRVLSVKYLFFYIFYHASLEWFLPVMFCTTIGMYGYILLYHKWKNKKLFAVLSAGLVTLITTGCGMYMYHDTPYIPVKLDSCGLALSFAIIGFWIRKSNLAAVFRRICCSASHTVYRILLAVGAVGVYTILAYWNSHQSYVNMADNALGNSALAYYAAGSVMFLFLLTAGIQLKDTRNILFRWLCLLGRHSMLVYLLHDLINRAIREIVRFYTNGALDLQPMHNLNFMWMAVFFGISMVLLTFICMVIEKRKL